MKVFISWSGELSHKVACEFRDWLPSVIQHIDPYVSSEDIDKGARWSTDIANELQESSYGILVITKDNIEAPWIAFEAGALSKTIEKSRVSPFLFNIKRSEIKGPLLQFQSTINNKSDIFKLVEGINGNTEESIRIEDSRLKHIFDVWWPELSEKLMTIQANIKPPSVDSKKKNSNNSDKILEEILDLVRGQQRLLSSPELIIPPNYLQSIMSNPKPERKNLTTRRLYTMVDFQIQKIDELMILRDSLEEKTKPIFSGGQLNKFAKVISDLLDVTKEIMMLLR